MIIRNLILLISLIFIYGCNSNVNSRENFSELESLIRKSSLIDLNNKKVDIKFFKGKRVVVNYWATWCRPCIEEMPGLLRAQKKLKMHNYQLLMISDESLEKISNFQKNNKYNFNFQKSNNPNESLGVFSLPTTYFFNDKGKKIETIVGVVDWDSKRFIEKLINL
tara:strand:+ start:116 stop:610 length:495 start_codon:yes stop_codon:yes gene_type:complete